MVPQRLACVWPLSRGRGPSSDEAGLHTGSALLEPLGCGRRQPAEPPSPLCRARPAASISAVGLERKGRYGRTSVKPGFWYWVKSCSAESAWSSLLRELSAQREFNSVTDFSYMYVYKKNVCGRKRQKCMCITSTLKFHLKAKVYIYIF